MSFSVAEDAYIDPTAVIIGNVRIANGASVWPYAVLRGDQNLIEIGEGSNIQDHVVIHVDPVDSAIIGKDVSVGHGAIIHGAEIGDRCIVGMNSTVLNGAKIGEETIIGAGALVPGGMRVPPRSIVVGVPGKVIKEDQQTNRDACERNASAYHRLRDEFIAGQHNRYTVP
jgi:carbonic anhydrase/acetyltransferase-like protein (isoleucine patch superfamily)